MHSKPPYAADGTNAHSHRFVDAANRRIAFEAYRPARFESLAEMYDDFAPAHRAQGLPPTSRERIETWLENVLTGTSVLAVHDDTVVGHVMFVADGDDGHELGVFVHQDYQDAGVGTNLLRAGFEHARRAGLSTVWLSVARSNHAARSVYERLGFREDAKKNRSVRMSREL